MTSTVDDHTMDRKEEFLDKLAALMREYDVVIDTDTLEIDGFVQVNVVLQHEPSGKDAEKWFEAESYITPCIVTHR